MTKNRKRPATPQPPRLQPDARALALPEVKKALAATHPSNRHRSDKLGSQLLGYLADPISGWDQTGSPCIASLLDEVKINKHGHHLAQCQVTSWTIKNRLTSLRFIHRALSPANHSAKPSRGPQSHGRNNIGAMTALDRLGDTGVSVAEISASWSDLINTLRIPRINFDRAIRGFSLNLENNPEKPLPVSAREIAAGTTSPEVVGKWKAFAEAMAPNSQAVISVGTDRRLVTAPSAEALSGKRTSNAAVKREAKAKHDRRFQRSAIFDMDQTSWPAWQDLDPTIRSWVESYKPELTRDEQWAILRPSYLRLMSLARPVSTTRALNISSHLSMYLKWVAERRPQEHAHEVLALVEFGTREDIDTWIASMSGGSKHSAASRRSDVRGVLNALYPESAPVRLPRQPASGPYSFEEIARMRALARLQPSALKSLHLSALIALCAGAGLTPGEAALISPNDLVTIELGSGVATYLVRVKGVKARTIPLSLAYVELLDQVLVLHKKLERGPGRHFLPQLKESVAHRVIVATESADEDGVDIQTYRLRATWLVTMLQAPIPLRELLQAAGLISTRILFDLLAYCEPVNQIRMQEILATAALTQVAS
jgi:integrase